MLCWWYHPPHSTKPSILQSLRRGCLRILSSRCNRVLLPPLQHHRIRSWSGTMGVVRCTGPYLQRILDQQCDLPGITAREGLFHSQHGVQFIPGKHRKHLVRTSYHGRTDLCRLELANLPGSGEVVRPSCRYCILRHYGCGSTCDSLRAGTTKLLLC